jgi:hypothetical protein|tara:strand:- start:2636 stop:2854 length:219 start_codon:yes stop_codon:yes gene_type:complete
MPVVTVSLSPEAYAIYTQWPTHSRTSGRSYNVSRCILFSRVWEAEVKRLQKEVKLLQKDKEVMWAMIEEAEE